MFAYFERLLDPYQPYDDSRPPPSKLFAFYREFLHPARWILGAAAIFSMFAAIAEAMLIQFAGQLVDILTDSTPTTLWRDHGTSILWMAAILSSISSSTRQPFHRKWILMRPPLSPE